MSKQVTSDAGSPSNSTTAADISAQRKGLAERLEALKRPMDLQVSLTDSGNLKWACAAIAQWLDNAGESERELAFEALQISVTATNDSATVSGVLPHQSLGGISPDSCQVPE